MQSKTVELEGVSLRLLLPTNYEETSRRFPLLLTLGNLEVLPSLTLLQQEGVVPEFLMAEVLSSEGPVNPNTIITHLSSSLRLLPSPSARWIIGTGHSAVTAMNAVLDHPEIFGKAACLSTSFEGIEGAPPLHSRILRSVEERLFLPKNTRLFFDYGTIALDECYEPYHRDLGAILRAKGWRDGCEFQITQVNGGTHDPLSWNTRLDPALRWLASH